MPVMVDSEGKYVACTPVTDVAAGEVVAQGDLVGIAPLPILAGRAGQLAVRVGMSSTFSRAAFTSLSSAIASS